MNPSHPRQALLHEPVEVLVDCDRALSQGPVELLADCDRALLHEAVESYDRALSNHLSCKLTVTVLCYMHQLGC